MPNTTVSIIMPVYNSERYVAEAVEAVLTQDLDGLQLILVDDGSSDASPAICDTFARRDGRVTVIHQANAGMCAARNRALAVATGEYVGFSDNDDIVLPRILARAYALAKKHDVDCVRFGRRMVMTDERGTVIRTNELVPKSGAVLRGEEIFGHFREVLFSEAVWTGIYRRSLVLDKGIRFDERLRHGGEDRFFFANLLEVATSVALMPEVGYVWNRRMGHSSSVDLSENKMLGHELSTCAEHHLMVMHGVNELDPEFYCRRMLNSLMMTMHDCAFMPLAASWKEQCEALDRFRVMYRPYAKELRKYPAGPASKLMFESVMSRAHIPPALFMRYLQLGNKVERLRKR